MVVLFIVPIGCSSSNDSGNGQNPPPDITYETAEAFPQLSFNQPVGLVNAGDQSNRLFVVEKSGTISVFQNNESTGSKTTFLDIRDRV